MSPSSLLPTEPDLETLADSTETLPKTNIQEERFLQSRLARQKKKNDRDAGDSNKSSKTDSLHAFWNVLRRKLKRWQERLAAVEEECNRNDDKKDSKNHQDARTELERLRLQLNQWRKYCLSNNIASTTDIASHGDEDGELLEILPEDLPVSDLRLLHTEFTKYSSMWDDVHDRLFPKGKFVFRRYREELARRKIQQEDLAKTHKLKNRPQDRASNTEQTSRHPIRGFGNKNDAILENISSLDIIVSATGSVSTTIHTPDEQDDDKVASPIDDKVDISAAGTVPSQLSSTSLLFRNLQHCSLVIHSQLHGLHLVDLSNVVVHVTQSMASGTVHVTNCHNLKLVLKESQQLRLHDSTDLTCHVNATIGAILEGCTRIVFAIPPAVSTTSSTLSSEQNETQVLLLDAKDFDWLRTGVPSPNFKVIEQDTPSPPLDPQQKEEVETIVDVPSPDEMQTPSNPTGVCPVPYQSTKLTQTSTEMCNSDAINTRGKMTATADKKSDVDDDDEL